LDDSRAAAIGSTVRLMLRIWQVLTIIKPLRHNRVAYSGSNMLVVTKPLHHQKFRFFVRLRLLRLIPDEKIREFCT
jgi:hypothetical protein